MSLSRDAIAIGHYHPETPEAYRWAIRWQYPHPTESSFVQALAKAAGLADDENLERIGRGWPALAEAVRLWRTVPGWSRQVEDWCEARATALMGEAKT